MFKHVLTVTSLTNLVLVEYVSVLACHTNSSEDKLILKSKFLKTRPNTEFVFKSYLMKCFSDTRWR